MTQSDEADEMRVQTHYCIYCGRETVVVDDVVCGDTLCTECGSVLDTSCGILYDDHTDHCDSSPEKVPNDPITHSSPSIYDQLFRQLSQYTDHVDRRSRIVLQTQCDNELARNPQLRFRKPINIVLAIFYRHIRVHLKDTWTTETSKEFSTLCDCFHTKTSSVDSIVRIIDKHHNDKSGN